MSVTLLLIIVLFFNKGLFEFFAVGTAFLQMLEATVELRFWNHVLDGQKVFLNFRQRS
jgi:hypothetical protein